VNLHEPRTILRDLFDLYVQNRKDRGGEKSKVAETLVWVLFCDPGLLLHAMIDSTLKVKEVVP
jgi:hypothetical protein